MSISGLHHLVLFCADTERSRQFYEALGFSYLRGYDGMHWFSLGDAELMLHPADPGQKSGLPAIHFATPDVDALFARARAAGLQPVDHQNPSAAMTEPVVRPWGDREFELLDPDGHVLAFTQVG
ncbi:MAG: VOC family protein [Anaerolineales bacterium]|nr:VOC family protein [Anaerolineales bacterium]